MEVKEKIEKIMAEKNLSVAELAQAVGVSQGSLNMVLKGKSSLSKYGVEKIDKYCADNGIAVD